MIPLVISQFIHAQDPAFSQFYANRLYLNPAFAGIEQDSRRLFLNYRNQWPAMNAGYVTYSASYDQYMPPLRGGLGIRVMNDVQGEGTINHFELGLIYSHHFRITRELTISTGIDAHIVQRNLNTSEMIFEDMIDMRTGLATITTAENLSGYQKLFPDFNAGASFFYKNLYGGVSVSHLLTPRLSGYNESESRLSRKVSVFAGAFIPVYEKRLGKEILELSPNIIYIRQQNFTQLTWGIEGIVKQSYIAGIWFRQVPGFNSGNLIFSGGYVTNTYRIRYSYDQQLSSPEVNLPYLGAHEISLIVTFDGKKKKKHKAIKCPKI